MSKPREIHALSFDFDGCLFHSEYFWNWNDLRTENQNAVINKNINLLTNIQSQRAQYDDEIILNGSIRQSAACDDLNATNTKRPRFCTESCFSALIKISTHLNATLCRFLLPDAFDDLREGTTFDQAMLALDETSPPLSQKKKYPVSTFISDDSKLTLLYAQMHKMAQDYPQDNITFDFYDDKGKAFSPKYELLENLYEFFSLHPDLVPKNVTLGLHQYHGKNVAQFNPIKGCGELDTNYKNTIKHMANIGKVKNPELYKEKNVVECVKHVKPQMLSTRKRLAGHFNMCFFGANQPKNTEEDTNTLSSRHGTSSIYNPQKPSINRGLPKV